MKLLTQDQRAFFLATGLDLDRLVERHLGKDSQDQIFEWITIVLGRQYFEFYPGSFAIHTLKGWQQYCKDRGFAFTANVEGNSSAAQ